MDPPNLSLSQAVCENVLRQVLNIHQEMLFFYHRHTHSVTATPGNRSINVDTSTTKTYISV